MEFSSGWNLLIEGVSAQVKLSMAKTVALSDEAGRLDFRPTFARELSKAAQKIQR